MASCVPCIIDQDINSAQPGNKDFCHLLYLFGVGDITRDRQTLATHRLDLSNQRFDLSICAGAHRHISSSLGKSQCDTATYSPACARYHCPPTCEREIN